MPGFDAVSDDPVAALPFTMGQVCPCCQNNIQTCCCPDRTLPATLIATLTAKSATIDPDRCCASFAGVSFPLTFDPGTYSTTPPFLAQWKAIITNGIFDNLGNAIVPETYYMEFTLSCTVVVLRPFGGTADAFAAFCGSLNADPLTCCAWRINVTVACGGRPGAPTACSFYLYDTFYQPLNQSEPALDPYYAFTQVLCDPFVLEADLAGGGLIGPSVLITE